MTIVQVIYRPNNMVCIVYANGYREAMTQAEWEALHD